VNVLVVAAHPDDEVLGCGGTIARLSKAGHKVHIAILGEGITSRYEQPERAEQESVRTLHEQCARAAEALGAQPPLMFSLPDNRFDTVPLLEIAKIIEGVIEQVNPQVIYTQHGGDLNIDHVMVYRATLTATRPLPGSQVRSVYAFEVASSSEWAFQQFSPAFHPNVFVDVSATLEQKIRAIECYENEVRAFPHPRSPEALRVIAQRWGSVAGLPAAEAFQLVRSINLIS